MSNQYVILRDESDGNESVGEMWQEAKIFDGSATLDEVMAWAMGSPQNRDEHHSMKRITIVKPWTSEEQKLNGSYGR